MLERIEKVLDERVRPDLFAHGGDIEALEFTEDGTFRFRLTGQCSGCPSAQITTEELIGKELMEAIPEIKNVVLVSGVSEDLLEQARKLLHHEL